MTTRGTITATRTAAASGEIDFDDLATAAPGGDAAVPLGLPVFKVLVPDAVPSKISSLSKPLRWSGPTCHRRR